MEEASSDNSSINNCKRVLRKRKCVETFNDSTSSSLSGPSQGPDAKKALFKCGQCSKILTTKAGFKNHLLRTHTEVKKYKCDECSKTFKHHSGLCQHRRSFHLDEPLICAICESSFNSRGNMKRHLQTHGTTEEEVNKIWEEHYLKTEKQVKAHHSLAIKKENMSQHSETTDDSDLSHTSITIKASTLEELRHPKLPRFSHLRLGMTIVPNLDRFEEGKRFAIPPDAINDDSSFMVFSCPGCNNVKNVSQSVLAEHISQHHPDLLEAPQYCEMCMKMVDNMATHLKAHQKALSDLSAFKILSYSC